MISAEQIWEYIESGEAFTVYLSDGRSFPVRDRHWIGVHPSHQGNTIIVYGSEPNQFHLIPLLAITSLSRNGQ